MALGAIFGSYINMAAYRLPRNISTVTRTRSFCPTCQHQLMWFDNIPILSYLSIAGRCRYCRNPIGVRYLLTELLVAALFALAAYQFFVLNAPLTWAPFSGNMPPPLFALQLFLIVDLVLLSVVDIETWIIPFETTLPWIVLGLILAPVFPELHGAGSWWTNSVRLNAFIDSAMGMVLGLGLPWMINFLTTFVTFVFYRMRGSNDRPREGMGMGDAHLLGMVGALMGWKAALATLFMGVFIGSVTGVAKILWDKMQRRRLGDRWKPWQPTYELPPEAPGAAPYRPRFWPLAIVGVALLIGTGLLYQQSFKTFGNRLGPTLDQVMIGGFTTDSFERAQSWMPSPPLFQNIDARMLPVYLVLMLAVMLIFASAFMTYLAAIDKLPQGDVQESEPGKQEEVLQGNYVPFGPSLALAALLVVFYMPLIRSVSFWFALGSPGRLTMPGYSVRVIGQSVLLPLLDKIINGWQRLFG